MTRAGAALFVALLVVLLGGMVAVLATMVAMSEVRSGTAWRDQGTAVVLAASAVARSRERAESLFDSLAAGASVALDDTVSLLRLGDSLVLLTVRARFGSGEETNASLRNASLDTLGIRRLTVPGSRARYHPIP